MAMTEKEFKHFCRDAATLIGEDGPELVGRLLVRAKREHGWPIPAEHREAVRGAIGMLVQTRVPAR
jgi:hypothetical protein